MLGTLCLISQKDGWAIKDENKNTNKYAEGSIGEMNGMNHPTIEITSEMNTDWLVNFVKR